jgi:hypothetical protein
MNAAMRIAALLVLAAISPASAQQTITPCSYDECALRIRAATFTRPQMLVRGQHETELVRLGLFQPAVSSFMTRSDSAVVYASVYDRLYDTGGVINIFGTALTVGSPIIFDGWLRTLLFMAVGLGLSTYGGYLTNQADEALSHAIWWHNRELTREELLPP